jgi:hypothetical protein
MAATLQRLLKNSDCTRKERIKKTRLTEQKADRAHPCEEQAGGQQKKGVSLWTDEEALR